MNNVIKLKKAKNLKLEATVAMQLLSSPDADIRAVHMQLALILADSLALAEEVIKDEAA